MKNANSSNCNNGRNKGLRSASCNNFQRTSQQQNVLSKKQRRPNSQSSCSFHRSSVASTTPNCLSKSSTCRYIKTDDVQNLRKVKRNKSHTTSGVCPRSMDDYINLCERDMVKTRVINMKGNPFEGYKMRYVWFFLFKEKNRNFLISLRYMTISLVYVTYDHIAGLCDIWTYRWSMRYMTISLVYAKYDHIAGLCVIWPYRWSICHTTISLVYALYDHIAGLYVICCLWLKNRWPSILHLHGYS